MSRNNDSRMRIIHAALAHPALALLAPLAICLVVASLAAAGTINMLLAYVLLGLAWLVATAGAFLAPWQHVKRHRAIVSCFLTLLLVGIGWFETVHYVEPLSAANVAQAVAKLLAPLPKTSETKPPEHSEPNIDRPLISTIAKTHFRCPLPSVPTDRTREQIMSDMKERIQAARGAFGISIEVSEIENGRKIVMEPLTDEAKTKMWGANRWTLEWRKSGPDLLITSITDLPDPLGALAKVTPAGQNPDQVTIETAYIEEEFHIPRGKCQML